MEFRWISTHEIEELAKVQLAPDHPCCLLPDAVDVSQTTPLAEGHMNIQMERRRLTILKVTGLIFAHLEKSPSGGQISREEFLNAVNNIQEVASNLN